jgi:hypothetical protein
MPLLPTATDIATALKLLSEFPQLAAKSKAISSTGGLVDQQLEALKVLLTAG